MAINFPGPYEIEYKYTTTINNIGITHSLALSCVVVGTPAVGAVPGSVALQTKSGASLALLTAVNDVWNIFRTGLSSTASASVGWTLWRYVPDTLAKDFITGGQVTNIPGTVAANPSPAAQTKCTFRSANGGIMQVNQLESTTSGTGIGPLVPAGTGAWPNVLAAYFLSASGWAIARDDSYPVAALNVGFGQNEALFKKRYRNV